MSHGKQEPMESGHYHDIIIVTSSSSWHHLFCLHQDGRFKKLSAKIHQLLPSIYTFFGLIFQKLLTCIRNDIVVIQNENWRKASYHASSDSATLCVCMYVMSDFWILHWSFYPVNNNGRYKIIVQNKIFSRPTDPTFWAVCNRNQTIILSRPKTPGAECQGPDCA